MQQAKTAKNIALDFHVPAGLSLNLETGLYRKKNIYGKNGKRNRYIRKTKHNGEIDPKTSKRYWEIKVSAIKNREKLINFVNILQHNSSTAWIGARNAMIFKFGTYTGLRVSDVLNLRAEDVFGHHAVYVTEQKTKKHRKIYLDVMAADLKEYQSLLPDDLNSPWLFPTESGQKPVSYSTFYQATNAPAVAAGIPTVGTHSMRKTFGYSFYQATINDPDIQTLPTLMTILNHSSERMTIRYIGLEESQISATLSNINPFN